MGFSAGLSKSALESRAQADMLASTGMPEKILVFSKYFGYDVGGAERSTLSLLRQKSEEENARVQVLLVENIRNFNSQNLKAQLPSGWHVEPIRIRHDGVRFKFFSYCVNRPHLKRLFGQQPPDARLYTYGILAPAALSAYRGPKVYLIRDELGLGLEINYYSGIKKKLRTLYGLADCPFRRTWLRDLHAGVRGAEKVIANSRFMAEAARRIFGLKAVDVIYPFIDVATLRRDFAAEPAPVERGERNVVAVGDNIIKGGDIARRLAPLCPQIRFHLFDRKFTALEKRDNLYLHPWSLSTARMLKHADAVIIPSRCEEAYSRLAREAKAVGLPVIATRRGGIPEAVESDPQIPHRFVSDVESLDAWKHELQQILGI